MALGHEIAAEVVEVGKNVTTVEAGRPGDRGRLLHVRRLRRLQERPPRVLPQPSTTMEGQPGHGPVHVACATTAWTSSKAWTIVPASLTEPLAVSLTAVLNAEIPLGGSVVVLGHGPLGLMAARLAKLRGAGFVAITGLAGDNPREKARFELAERVRLRHGHPGGQAERRGGDQEPGSRTASTGSSSARRPRASHDAFKVIHFGGIITFFGLHFGGKNMVNLDVNDMIFRKITLIPTFAEPAINFPVSNRLLRDGLVDASSW